MKFLTGLLAAVLLIAGMGASHAVVRIADDRGGRIGTYVDRYQDLRQSGDTVIIDGLYASACTMVLGALPCELCCVLLRSFRHGIEHATNLCLPASIKLRLSIRRYRRGTLCVGE